MKSFFAFISIVLISFACKPSRPIEGIFPTSDGAKIDMAYHLDQTQAVVLIYLSPECPLCVNYTRKINELQQIYQGQLIEFIGVVSGDHYTAAEVETFRQKYELKMEILMDKDFLISQFFGASVTPSVSLLDSLGQITYSGAIDNWPVSLRRKRIAATKFYLEDALDAYLAGTPIAETDIEAVGCLIE